MARLLGALVVLGAFAACGQASPGPGPGGSTPVAPQATTRPLSSQPVAADGGPDCPASISDAEGMTVPAKPQGVDGAARLLPDRVPSSLVVCSYPVLDIESGPLATPFALTERTAVTGSERGRLVELLTWAPRGDGRGKICTEMGGNETVHLVGVRYDDAAVWVSAKSDPNSCSNATNGDFTSSAAVGVAVDALVGGRPLAPTTDDPCLPMGYGRLGDDVSLAPDGEPLVTVCRLAATGGRAPTQLGPDRSREVVAALRALPVRPTGHFCEGADPSAMDDFRLLLSYPEGPPAVVDVTPTCAPPVLGSSVESPEVGEVVRLVEQWSPPIQGPDKDGAVSSGAAGS
jgi:hypothetical protein